MRNLSASISLPKDPSLSLQLIDHPVDVRGNSSWSRLSSRKAVPELRVVATLLVLSDLFVGLREIFARSPKSLPIHLSARSASSRIFDLPVIGLSPAHICADTGGEPPFPQQIDVGLAVRNHLAILRNAEDLAPAKGASTQGDDNDHDQRLEVHGLSPGAFSSGCCVWTERSLVHQESTTKLSVQKTFDLNRTTHMNL